MFVDEIEKLVSQTMKDSEEFVPPADSDFIFDSFDREAFLKEEEVSKQVFPQAPGIFYKVEKKISSFLLRIYPTDDLAAEHIRLQQSPEEFDLFKFEDPRSEIKELHYFECDSLLLAQKLQQTFSNRRFSLHEEILLNVSDPGDTWWLKKEVKDFKLYFRLSDLNNFESMIKLGPMGERETFVEVFQNLPAFLNELIPFEHCYYTHGHFSLSLKQESGFFRQLITLFKTGDVDYHFWEFFRELEFSLTDKEKKLQIRQLQYYLITLATKRRFWLEAEEAIENLQ